MPLMIGRRPGGYGSPSCASSVDDGAGGVILLVVTAAQIKEEA